MTEIKVVFDLPMWTACGRCAAAARITRRLGQAEVPDAAGTTWTIPVKLKSDWTYEFSLNAGQYNASRSDEGVPLESVHVTLKTAGKAE